MLCEYTMTTITKFTSDGRILGITSCPERMIADQLIDGQDYIEGAYSSLRFYIDVDSKVALAKDIPPSPHHTFNYTTKQWVANPAAAWAAVKLARQKLLTESDWRVTKAAESGQPVPPEWVVYRQALRDITSQADPLALDWPVAP